MARFQLSLEWKPASDWTRLTTGVSLHSHTAHSRETLDFLPRFAAGLPWLARLLAPYERRYAEINGRPLNWASVWWTPPMSAREALSIERGAIENRLNFRSLVSLTDHDNIDAGLLLRVLPEERALPISVEWTVPFRGATFHLGVHNLPPRSAPERMRQMAAFTANPDESSLRGLLDWLSQDEETLIVFNHPYWDERGVGRDFHAHRAHEFVALYKAHLHALEVNGLRHWHENAQVVEFGRRTSLPVVAGGDRHGCEANAVLNLTNAATFSEFVGEVRFGQISRVLLASSYRESMVFRICTAVADAIRDNENHAYGWRRWCDRVFYEDGDGSVHPLTRYWEGDEPTLVRQSVALAQFLDWRGVRTALRAFGRPAEEFSF